MNPFAKDFPIVCVGGSAGASGAYAQLLKYLSPGMGVAIVIVNHIRKRPPRSTRFFPATQQRRLS